MLLHSMLTVVQDLLELSAPGAEVELIEAAELPRLQRRLLDHHRDMTGTLEAFSGESLRLRVLRVRQDERWMHRRVVLLAGDEAVEYGAIRIDLDALPASVRPAVEEAELPLGGLLTRAGIPLVSEARSFLRTSASTATEALGVEGPVFGRFARLLDGQGRTLADVVEILPHFQGRD